MIFNDRLDAAVAAFFLISVVIILADSIRTWVTVLQSKRVPVSSEAPYVATALVG
jgi:carbon starvation protein